MRSAHFHTAASCISQVAPKTMEYWEALESLCNQFQASHHTHLATRTHKTVFSVFTPTFSLTFVYRMSQNTAQLQYSVTLPGGGTSGGGGGGGDNSNTPLSVWLGEHYSTVCEWSCNCSKRRLDCCGSIGRHSQWTQRIVRMVFRANPTLRACTSTMDRLALVMAAFLAVDIGCFLGSRRRTEGVCIDSTSIFQFDISGPQCWCKHLPPQEQEQHEQCQGGKTILNDSIVIQSCYC